MIAELVPFSDAGVVALENQRAKPLTVSGETDGVGPEDSVRGNTASCGGASNSTSIVAEVNKIAGPPGMGPETPSAVTIAMTGSPEER